MTGFTRRLRGGQKVGVVEGRLAPWQSFRTTLTKLESGHMRLAPVTRDRWKQAPDARFTGRFMWRAVTFDSPIRFPFLIHVG